MPGVVQGVSGSVPGRVRDFLRSCVFQGMLSVVQGVSGRVFDSVFGSVYRFSGSFMEHLGCFQTFEIVFSTLFTDYVQSRVFRSSGTAPRNPKPSRIKLYANRAVPSRKNMVNVQNPKSQHGLARLSRICSRSLLSTAAPTRASRVRFRIRTSTTARSSTFPRASTS